MNEQVLASIKHYLQSKDAQERIYERMHRARSEVAVSLGQAARLFYFSENQLRNWGDLGLLKPLRSNDGRGQRLFPPSELDKLAIIRELLEAGYSPGEIPPDIDILWEAIYSLAKDPKSMISENVYEHVPIDVIIEHANTEEFWHYFIAQVLRLSILLICQDISDTNAGLVLPLRLRNDSASVLPYDLPEVGESLIGWLDQERSIHVFLDSAPSFEFPSDFRVKALRPTEEDTARDNTLIVVPRKARPLNLSISVVETIRHLLSPLYEFVEDWRSSFNPGLRNALYPAANFTNGTSSGILKGLADMVVHLGGRMPDGQDRWRFCCILTSIDPQLPLQQRSLVVRAQSKHSPHKVGVTTIIPDEYLNSPSIRALQSGHIVYRPEILVADITIALHELESPIRSVIAVPLGGENGEPIAVLYITSSEEDAFSENDQRVLRIMGRIVEELLLTYRVRQQVAENLGYLIMRPSVVDALFGDFLSEDEFRRDVEGLLARIRTRMDERDTHEGLLFTKQVVQPISEELSEEVISFIGVDVDNESELANKYGDRVTRNFNRSIGLRILEWFPTLFTKSMDYQLYHVYSGRFYLILKGISFEQARAKAEQLRQILKGSYRIDPLHVSIERSNRPNNRLEVSDITTHLGVISYTHTKLKENLVSSNPTYAVAEVREKIIRELDMTLRMGKDQGGDVVIASFSPEIASLSLGGEIPQSSGERIVFVSHSHKDDEFGIKLVRDLRHVFADDTAVWYDAFGGLRGGDVWWQKIKEELTARPIFIVVLSPDAIDSKWVNDEINIAWKQKNSAIGKRIIPILYRPCKVPEDLDTLQVISFLQPKTYETAFNELLKALILPEEKKGSGLAFGN